MIVPNLFPCAPAETKTGLKPKLWLNEPRTWDDRIDHGERIVSCLVALYGNPFSERLLDKIAEHLKGPQPSVGHDKDIVYALGVPKTWAEVAVPRGFWHRYISSEMGQLYSDRIRMRLRRSLAAYTLRRHEGAQTRAGLRGMRSGTSYRSSGAAENATKALGLHFMLLQFFVT